MEIRNYPVLVLLCIWCCVVSTTGMYALIFELRFKANFRNVLLTKLTEYKLFNFCNCSITVCKTGRRVGLE